MPEVQALAGQGSCTTGSAGDDSMQGAGGPSARGGLEQGPEEASKQVPRGDCRRILLILDMNGLLLDTRHRFCVPAELPANREPDARTANCLVYFRPHASEFIQFCLDRFDVGIWSSAARHNLMALVDLVFAADKQRLAFIWDQSKCTNTGLKHPQNKHKPLFLKELSRLWSAVDGQGQAEAPCTCTDASKAKKKRKKLGGAGVAAGVVEDGTGAKRGKEDGVGAVLVDAPAAGTDAVAGQDAVIGQEEDAVTGQEAHAVTGQDAAPVAGRGTDSLTVPVAEMVAGQGTGAVSGHDNNEIMGQATGAGTVQGAGAGADAGVEQVPEGGRITAMCEEVPGDEGGRTDAAQTAAAAESGTGDEAVLGASEAQREHSCGCAAAARAEESAAERWRRGMYGITNTLLVDDSPYKASKNPPYTCVFPPPYDASNQGSTTDTMLDKGGGIRAFLEGLLEAEDVREYVRKAGFGQAPVVLGPQGQMLPVTPPPEHPAGPTQATPLSPPQATGAPETAPLKAQLEAEKAKSSAMRTAGHPFLAVGAPPAVAPSKAGAGARAGAGRGATAPLRSPWTPAERPLQAVPIAGMAACTTRQQPAWASRAAAGPHGFHAAAAPSGNGVLPGPSAAPFTRPSGWGHPLGTWSAPAAPGQAGRGAGILGWPAQQGPFLRPQSGGGPSAAVLASEGRRESAFGATASVRVSGWDQPPATPGVRTSGWDQAPLPQPQGSPFLRPGAPVQGGPLGSAPGRRQSTAFVWSRSDHHGIRPHHFPELARIPVHSARPAGVPWGTPEGHPSHGQPHHPAFQHPGQPQLSPLLGQRQAPSPGTWPSARGGPWQGPWGTPGPQGPAHLRPGPFLPPGKWGTQGGVLSGPAPTGYNGGAGGRPSWLYAESHEQRQGSEARDARWR